MQMSIEDFFLQTYEIKINKNMLTYSYSFPKEDVLSYVDEILSFSIESIINYIYCNTNNIEILPRDVFQFSKLDDVTLRFCNELRENGNPGMKSMNIGALLLDDGKKRNNSALIKYGENHAKAAENLSLAFDLCNTYFLSCIGIVYPDLNVYDQEKLLVRLVLRNKLVSRLLKASKNGIVNMRQFLYCLSDSTYIRRKSNIRTIINILNKSDEYDFSIFSKNLCY